MKNKYLGIICILYSGIISYLWYFDKLKNYLAPQLQLYIKIALFPLIIMGIVLLFNHDNDSFKMSDIVLLLPIFLLFLTGNGRLTMNLANNRMNNFASKGNVTYIGPIEEDIKEIDVSDVDFTNTYFDVKDSTYDDLANYITFIPNARDYEGKTIRVRGFSVKYGSIVPDGYFAIGKYIISCCVADAEFGGFIVKNNDFNVMHNKWYEIEGVLEQMPLNDRGYVMYIKIVNIKEIDGNNEEQYVYPCYSYDDGLCADTQKYELNYD